MPCTPGQSNFPRWACYAHSWRTTTSRSSKQKPELTARLASTALPPLLPAAANSPKMTINLAPYRRPPLLSHIRSGAQKPAVFLIQNPRSKFRPTHGKLSPLKSPNRERMAIHRRAFSLPSFEPSPASLQHPWPPPYDRRLIANLELNLRLTGRKTNHIQSSNRKILAVFALNSPVSTANCLFLNSGSSNLRWRD